MRSLRSVLPALVLAAGAALAWLASAWFETLSRSASGRLNAVVFGVPGNPAAVPRSGPPWDAIETAVLCLLVGALAASAALLVAVPPGRRLTRFAAAWLAVVLAGAVAGVVLALVTFFGTAAGPVLVGLDLDAWREGAVWGLVWGWIPALGYVLAERQTAAESAADADPSASPPARTPAPAPATRIAWLATAVVLAVVAVVGGAISRPAAQEATNAAIAAERARAAAQEAQAAAAAEPPAPDSIGAPGAVDEDACPAESVRYAVVSTDAALGARFARIAATNAGAAPCVVDGYPDVAFGDGNDGLLAAPTVPGPPTDPALAAAPARIVLAPGATAVADLRWRGGPAAGEPDARWLHLAASPGMERARIAFPGGLGAENTVAVSAWRPDLPAAPGT